VLRSEDGRVRGHGAGYSAEEAMRVATEVMARAAPVVVRPAAQEAGDG